MDDQQRELVLRYQPYIYRDRKEPFPIRFVGCTIFTEKARSESFPKWVVDPAAAGAQAIIEYAIYYDYDIQHMYDLEHIWVAVDVAGNVIDCWCSFHGMRLRAAGVRSFRLDDTHPILYSQPGKHAMLPHPELFELHPQLYTACTVDAGGGLLIPSMLDGVVQTTESLDDLINSYIRTNYTFTPSMEFIWEQIAANKFISWPELLRIIPELIQEQVKVISSWS